MCLLKIAICTTCVLLLNACDGSGGDSEGNQKNTDIVQASPSVVMIASLANQQVFSLNNEWTQADLDQMNVAARWAGTSNAFETRIFETNERYGVGGYKDRLAECNSDFALGNQADGNRKCYPRLTLHDSVLFGDDVFTYRCANKDNIIEFNRMRYGYWCGKGHGQSDEAPKPSAMDAVDACCRYHDLQKWGGDTNSNQEGMVMCLSMAKSSPINLLTSPVTARIAESRHCWYDWSRWVIGGEQPNNPPAPKPY